MLGADALEIVDELQAQRRRFAFKHRPSGLHPGCIERPYEHTHLQRLDR